jgi:hypothetical protein
VIKHGGIEGKIKVCKISGIGQPLHVSLLEVSMSQQQQVSKNDAIAVLPVNHSTHAGKSAAECRKSCTAGGYVVCSQ